MGMYWNGYKTEFEKIDFLKSRIDEVDSWSELLKYCEAFDTNDKYKSTYITQNTTPIEYGTRYMSEKEKMFYNTFFYFTIWETYDEEDEKFIDKTKYTSNLSCDDLGWLKYDKEYYRKAFNTKTLKRIIKDYEKVDFNLLQEKFNLARLDSQKMFSTEPSFSLSKYRKEIDETFRNFKELTNHTISIYKNCVSDNKDLIIDIG